MGYTHYWRIVPVIEAEKFKAISADFKRLMPVFRELGLTLAGGSGKGKPVINDAEICFNGKMNCRHQKRDLGITWPADSASGLGIAYSRDAESRQDEKLKEITGKDGTIGVLIGNPLEWVKDSDVSGAWFAGAKLNTRTCGGDCSHETFVLSQKMGINEWAKPENGLYFEFCKTAFKPYDLAVICALTVAKHHLGSQIKVSSDGTPENWADGVFLCNKVLGYGDEVIRDLQEE
jgi:hypothetical protein